MNHTARAVACLALLLSAGLARGQETWSLTTADLNTEAVRVQSFDSENGVAATPLSGGDETRVPIDRFVELSRPVTGGKGDGGYDLHLVGGGLINGDPAGMKGDSLVWKNAVAGEVVVPLTRVAGLTKAGARFVPDRRRDDLVTLANGDVVRGTLVDLTPEQVVVQTDAGNAPVPFASLSSIALASTVQLAGAKPKPSFRVTLDEGSVLSAATARIAGDKLQATVGGEEKSIDLARIASIEQVNGPVAFLASRQPSANVYTPYLGTDQRFLARMNVDFEGSPIRFRDRVYPRSIATHSYSKLTWPLDGNYAALRTRYAMDPKASQGAGGDVTVRILVDDKVVHEQKNVRPGQLSDPVVVDVAGGKELSLVVDFGQMIDSNDRLNWIEPVLLKEKPEPAKPATKPATKPAEPQSENEPKEEKSE